MREVSALRWRCMSCLALGLESLWCCVRFARHVRSRYFSLRSGCCRLRRFLRFLSRDFLGFSDFTSSGTAGGAANRSLNFLFTVRCVAVQLACGTAQWQSSIRLGLAYTRIPMLKPLGRATNHGGQNMESL